MRRALSLAVLTACQHAAHEPASATVIEVTASLPGASSQTVASEVATPLERALGQLPHVSFLTSVSTEGATRLRVGFHLDDSFAAGQAVQGALNASASLLPPALPSPPIYSRGNGPLVGRYLVPVRDAEAAAQRVAELPGVGRVETCGLPRRELHIIVDPQLLAATGVTISDARSALQQHTGSAGDLAAIVIATRNGAPVRMSDVARVEDGFEPMRCIVVASAQLAELEIDAQTAAAVEPVRTRLASAGVHLIALPLQHELHLALVPDLTLAKTEADLRDALANVSEGTIVEIHDGAARMLTANPKAVMSVLAKLPIVTSAGVPTATVHVGGADPQAVAKTAHEIAERLRAAGLLVATHGLATHKTVHFDIDRDAAPRLGVTSNDIEDTLHDASGRIMSTLFTQESQIRVTMQAGSSEQLANPEQLASLHIRSAGGAVVPLAQLVRVTESTEPLEVLHRGELPDVDLEVSGDPRDAIGTVPAGLRVEVEAAE